MRTTLDVDDDVLMAGREAAQARRTTIGAIVSERARSGLRRDVSPEVNRDAIRTLPRRGLTTPITIKLVSRLRDEMP